MRHLSQEALGRKVGRDFRTVSAYEREGVRIPADFLRAAAEALGVQQCDIEGDEPQSSRDNSQEKKSGTLLEILPQDKVDEIFNHLVESVKSAHGEERRKILKGIQEITFEMERRLESDPDVIAHAAGRQAVADVLKPGVVYPRKLHRDPAKMGHGKAVKTGKTASDQIAEAVEDEAAESRHRHGGK